MEWLKMKNETSVLFLQIPFSIYLTSDLLCSVRYCLYACVRAVCFSFVAVVFFLRLHIFPIFLELNESQFVVRIFDISVWPWTNNIFDPLCNPTGSDGAMFRQVETPYNQKKHVYMHNAHAETQKAQWVQHKKMNESSTFEKIMNGWIRISLKSLKSFYRSVTGCLLHSLTHALAFIFYLTEDWSGFGKQRTQSLDYKTNTNPFAGCQNSNEFRFCSFLLPPSDQTD